LFYLEVSQKKSSPSLRRLKFCEIGKSAQNFVNRYQTPKRRNGGEGEGFFFFYEIPRQNNLNPRPAIDLLSRAITEPGGPFLLVVGPAFNGLLTNSGLFTAAVGSLSGTLRTYCVLCSAQYEVWYKNMQIPEIKD
jgi:hypothetical protein